MKGFLAHAGVYSCYDLLHRRCVPLGLAQLGVISPSDVARALETASACSHVIAIAWFKTVTNAWTTSYRMHEPDKLKCLFGCDAKDSLEHYIICRLLWSVLDCAFGGNLNPNLFARVNYSAPSSRQCCLIATAFEIYHALKIGQRALVDTALSCRRFAPIITVAELIAADCARKVGNLESESDSSSTSSSSVSSDVSA